MSGTERSKCWIQHPAQSRHSLYGIFFNPLMGRNAHGSNGPDQTLQTPRRPRRRPFVEGGGEAEGQQAGGPNSRVGEWERWENGEGVSGIVEETMGKQAVASSIARPPLPVLFSHMTSPAAGCQRLQESRLISLLSSA